MVKEDNAVEIWIFFGFEILNCDEITKSWNYRWNNLNNYFFEWFQNEAEHRSGDYFQILRASLNKIILQYIIGYLKDISNKTKDWALVHERELLVF